MFCQFLLYVVRNAQNNSCGIVKQSIELIPPEPHRAAAAAAAAPFSGKYSVRFATKLYIKSTQACY